MTDDVASRRSAWLVLAFVALANYGNFYVYDSIGPVGDLPQRQRGFSDTQIGMLNAIYSLPNIVLLLVGGMLVDRYGAARMMVGTGIVCLAGALLTAVSPDFTGMATGRPQHRHRSCRRIFRRHVTDMVCRPMMLFFFTSGALGFGLARMLRLTAGRRHHETVTHGQ